MIKHRCPVCAYPDLTEPPADYFICPCCGTEFGNDDTIYSYEELRDRWIKAEMPWFSHATPPPVNWNPVEQLRRAGRAGAAPALSGSQTGSYSSASAYDGITIRHVREREREQQTQAGQSQNQSSLNGRDHIMAWAVLVLAVITLTVTLALPGGNTITIEILKVVSALLTGYSGYALRAARAK